MRTLRFGLIGLSLGLGSLLPSVALAQSSVARPLPLPSYGRSVAGTDDGTAVVINPGNLGFMPGPEVRWMGRFLDENALLPYQGHAFSLATSLPFGLGTALRLDLVDPPAALASLGSPFAANYNWLHFGLGYRASDSFGLGFSYKHSFSDNRLTNGIDSWSFGASIRPARRFGISLVAHDVGNPHARSGDALAASYDLALAVRPFATRVLELGLESRYVAEEHGYFVPRATLGVDIPELGRLRGEFSVADPTEEVQTRRWLASAVMSFGYNAVGGAMEFGAGTVFGDALGRSARGQAEENLAFDVAFKGYREPRASEPPMHAIRLRLENTPDNRGHVALLRRLWNIAEQERSAAAVLLELRASPGNSLPHIQELRDAIHKLRTAGKQVFCHLEDADGGALYLCSAANRIWMSPGGGYRFAGLKARYLYFKNLLDNLGVRADFVRIGAHKSAPESFMQEGSSDVARQDKIDLLQQYERQFTLGVASGRNIEPLELRRRIAQGPFIASEAKAQGLVDELAFDDEVDALITKTLGGRVPVIDDNRHAAYAPSSFGSTRGLCIVYVDGDMVDGRSQVIPLLGMRLVGSYTIADSIKKARENPMVGAVVLRVESGGGSALAADVIWREVQLTRQVKPVIVSMGSSAASAAYYIAAPATRVIANPLSLTGSIGVFYGKADVSELLRKIGVNVELYKTAPRADAESLFRPFTAEEKKELERKVAQFYEQFLSRVSAGRRMTRDQVDAVGQGRVWTGEQALSRGLVDQLGGLRQAIESARELAGLGEEAPIVELPPVETSLLGKLLGIEGLHAESVVLPPELLRLGQALAPFMVHPAEKPLYRMELTDIAP
ncbi:MAG TPA: signal peptide peptidase SppA [Polyangiaceae bacterium]|nr:signal peptide peptidase SppA [Polyangiaceae bacterium]